MTHLQCNVYTSDLHSRVGQDRQNANASFDSHQKLSHATDGDWPRKPQLTKVQRIWDCRLFVYEWETYVKPLPPKAQGPLQRRGRKTVQDRMEDVHFKKRTDFLDIWVIIYSLWTPPNAETLHKTHTCSCQAKISAWRGRWGHESPSSAEEPLATDSFWEMERQFFKGW